MGKKKKERMKTGIRANTFDKIFLLSCQLIAACLVQSLLGPNVLLQPLFLFLQLKEVNDLLKT